jgi:retinol dehydrogenase 12
MTEAGRVFVVTGANTGIGLATARELAKRGGRVVLACRSREKTEPIVAALKAETGNEAIDFLGLDLGSLASVRRAASELLERGHPIHVLVNNAGVGGQRGVTTDGFELAFGVNHLGHFLFTTLLLDRLRASAPARVVTVASRAHFRVGGIDWEKVRGRTRSFTGWPEYCVSKLANVLFSAELARRGGGGVTSYALHPGVIASDLWRRVPWPFRPLVTAFMTSAEDGARTSVHCATAAEAAGQTGLYWDESAPRKPSRPARDEVLQAEAWAKSEAMVRG